MKPEQIPIWNEAVFESSNCVGNLVKDEISAMEAIEDEFLGGWNKKEQEAYLKGLEDARDSIDKLIIRN